MDHCDVAVVGAGLAGLETARRLARTGLAVTLVDRQRELARVHTTGVFVRRTLEDFAFPENTLGPPVRDVTLVSPAGREIDLRSGHDEFRVGRMAALYQARLTEVCALGAAWWPGHTLTALESWGFRGSLLRLTGPGGERCLTARFVVGADGARSRVAQWLGLDRNQLFLAGVEEVVRGVPGPPRPRFWCWLDPRTAPGYLGWVIHDGDEAHWGSAGLVGRFRSRRALAAIRACANRWLDLSGANVVERRGGIIPVGGVLRRIASPRGLLVGDAAGAPSPLTAGGLDPCLRLATLAADLIPRWLSSGDPVELARYDGRHFRARFTSRLLMRRLYHWLSNPRLVEFGFSLLECPPIRGLARRVFFGPGSFPDVGVPVDALAPGRSSARRATSASIGGY